MLQDESEDFQDTWRFLQHRIEDVGNAGNAVSQLTGCQWVNCPMGVQAFYPLPLPSTQDA